MLERWTEVSGLLAALCWAIGGLIYSRLPVGAGALNLGKNLIGSALLAGFILGSPHGRRALADAPLEAIGWLAASAVVGIFIGDASYLRALQVLGPRRALILSTLVPVFSVAVGWFFLAETLGGVALAMIAVTSCGVAIVIRERSPARPETVSVPPAAPRPTELGGSPREGFAHGVNAALCQAIGAALSKKGMAAVPPFEATFIRLLVALLGGVILAIVTGRLIRWFRQLRTPGVPIRILIGSFTGTFLGIWLSLVAIDALPIAVANTQVSLTPIFITILVAVFWRERVSPRAWLGTLVATLGAVALILASTTGN